MKKIFLIDYDYVNSRLDKWFKKKVSDVPQSFIEKNLRKGNIRINNKKTKSSYKVQINDKVLVKNFDLIKTIDKKKLYRYEATKKDLSFSSEIFIENNEDFVVINKPAGIPVQSGTKSRRNILDILRKTKEFSDSEPYTVHRIDKNTTGILIVAKNRKSAQLFTSLFRIRKIHKTYLGLVFGKPQKSTGTLIDTLIYYEGEKKVYAKAITHYSVLDSNNNYSLLKINPETGRKHQIRKQLLIHGCPIIGDDKYRLTYKSERYKNSLMLHAYKINFSIGQKKYNFKAEPTFEFKKIVKEKYLKIF